MPGALNARTTLVALASFVLIGCGGGGGGSDSPGVASTPPGNNAPQPGSGNIELAWTPPTQKADGSSLTDLAGYRFYLGTQSGRYDQTITVETPGIARYVIDNLSSGTYYVAMTSYRQNGIESDLSNEVSKLAN